MKQISQNLSAVESAVAQLCAALRDDAQSEAGQVPPFHRPHGTHELTVP